MVHVLRSIHVLLYNDRRREENRMKVEAIRNVETIKMLSKIKAFPREHSEC